MVYRWEPGTKYEYGSVVEYEGHKYKVIQPHTSQSDWAPPITPALWGRLQEEYGGGEHHGEHHGEKHGGDNCHKCGGGGHKSDQCGDHKDQCGSGGDHHQAPGYQPGYQNPNQNQNPMQQSHLPIPQAPGQTVQIGHEEHKKDWYDIDDKRKQELEIGGGLLAGIAAIGVGYYAYHEHGKNEEEKKAQTWALSSWLRDAQARTDDFHQNGPRGPVTWLLTDGHNIPQGAIQGGNEEGTPLYICRAYFEGGIQPGKVSPKSNKGAVIGYAHKEVDCPKYEILVGNPSAIRWVQTSGSFNPGSVRATPIEGGREPNGTPLFIAQAPYKGNVVPGKCSEKLGGALVAAGGKEREINEYAVLVYA